MKNSVENKKEELIIETLMKTGMRVEELQKL